MRPKLLITGGCSFSQVPNTDVTWAKHLEQHLDPDHHIHTGKGATGNEIISHRVIYKVNKALEQGFNTEDILVGISWSGCDRMALMTTNFDKMWEEGFIIGPPPKNTWTHPLEMHFPEFYDRENPQTLGKDIAWYVANSPSWVAHNENNKKTRSKDWHTFNPYWPDSMTKKYYKDFISPEYALIQTCQHILRTQWYLNTHHIKYFMTEYDLDVFTYHGPPLNQQLPDAVRDYNQEDEGIPDWSKPQVSLIDEHPEVNWLYKMIDRSYWLPVDSLGQWAKHVSEYNYARPKDPHPSTEQHKDFTEKVILPFILEKYNIS